MTRWYHNQITAVLLFAVCVSGQNNWQNQQSGNDCCEEYCYVKDEEPHLYFGTKTAYDSLSRRSGSQHIVPDCTPVKFWSLVRYGTRLPSAEKIEKLRNMEKLHREILNNYKERRSYPDKGRLCIDDYNLFARWRWNDTVVPEKAYSLTRQGEDDLKLLARRYMSKYPQLLPRSYDERSYYFQYENADKIQASYRAYIDGLFGSQSDRVHANVGNDDRLRKPEESCRNVDERQNQNFAINNNEYNRFLLSAEYNKTATDIFRRLGFRYDLEPSIIKDIYDVCRYEKAWNVQERSAWCIAFTERQLQLLEYAEDLKHYYKNGYGNRMSEKIGCSPVKDFYERFEKTVNGDNSGNNATFFFTKTSTLLKVLTAMGIRKDYTPLTPDNFYQQTRRLWKTSELSPFAANLAAILYECRGSDKYKVMFFLNEVPVEFPECAVGLCSWSAVEQKFQGLVKNCNVEDPCGENSSFVFKFNFVLYSVAAAILLYITF